MKKSYDKYPCRKCAKIRRPMFIECEIEKLEHELTTYDKVRPLLIRVVTDDIPHLGCQDAIIDHYDHLYARG